MEADQLGLFDLPADDAPPRSRRPDRGRNRESWACTVHAVVSIVDEVALREAEAEQAEGAVVYGRLEAGIDANPAPDHEDHDPPETAMETLTWLVWPTVGLEQALEAGAFLIESEKVDVVSETDDAGTVAWTVVVTLTQIAELRRLAVEAEPEQPYAEEVVAEADLATVWRRAFDPFAPLRCIPGIDWQPGAVTIEHLRA